MERINYNSLKFIEFFENLNPQNSGIFVSIFIHLVILLFAVGIPNLFTPNNIYVPNIIPIEILNIDETTVTKKTDINDDFQKKEKLIEKNIKFNSSENKEIVKQIEIEEKNQNIDSLNEEAFVEVKEKVNNTDLKEKKIIINEKKEMINKFETVKSETIKPKLKPKPVQNKNNEIISDLNVQEKAKDKQKIEKKDILSKPKPKPKKDFSIASMLKDLRNEKSNNTIEEKDNPVEEKLENKNDETNQNLVLSISEIDLLRQQLSSCWNAPAGAIIERGMKVTISAKVQQNMNVLANSVRIVDTNISKSNAFYGPITDSAMRTLLNPECIPLKLPKDKYNLWKNLTITFDYSIMKGY